MSRKEAVQPQAADVARDRAAPGAETNTEILVPPATIKRSETGNLRTLLLDGHEPVFLLGAGASVTSGVPLAREVAERAARWAWCWENGRSPHDQQVVRSDWWPWLSAKPWYDKDKDLADLYPTVIAELLGVHDRRREFFQDLIAPKVPPSEGYEALASMLHEGWITTVLTTNFDQRLEEAKTRLGRPHHIVSMRTPSDLVRLVTAPRTPQLVYLHGSVDHYSDRNLIEEVQTLEDGLADRLAPFLRDHPVVVVGYRGAEPSIMRGLLLDYAEAANNFVRGIYWCVHGEPDPAALPPMVLELASRIKSNFQLVPIRGFDDLMMHDLWKPMAAAGAQPLRRQRALPVQESSYDMRPMEGESLEALDWSLIRSRMQQYASQLGLVTPEAPERDWVIAEARQRHLTIERNGFSLPTNAGWLLFVARPHSRMVNALVRFTAVGPASWLRQIFGADTVQPNASEESDVLIERLVEGNLWTQLDTLSDLLALLNQGFRLKEEVSRTVYPYDPIALKEIIVNALVHRDYELTSPVEVTVRQDCLTVTSPGGLIPDVADQMHGESLEQAIRAGRKGIKGYRNPVISDLFYGGGRMDRRGSGLSDVIQKARANGGEVKFGPNAANDQFEVILFARPEAVDEITKTASPIEVQTARYAANILAVETLPETIWHCSSPFETIGQVRDAVTSGTIPPAYYSDGRIFSFFDLEALGERPTSRPRDEDIETLSLDEFISLPNGERALVQLLNDALAEHLENIGLIVERGRHRAYFPKEQTGERQIAYQGRVRRAVRTVAKARMRRNSGDIIYWEHKAVSYQFMRFGACWGLILNPGYAFTRDGERKALGRERINVLSTRRAARDYNQTVHQDVTFWAAIISGGEGAPFKLLTKFEGVSAPEIVLANRPPTITVSTPNLANIDDTDSEDPDLAELEKELESLADEDEEAADEP